MRSIAKQHIEVAPPQALVLVGTGHRQRSEVSKEHHQTPKEITPGLTLVT